MRLSGEASELSFANRSGKRPEEFRQRALLPTHQMQRMQVFGLQIQSIGHVRGAPAVRDRLADTVAVMANVACHGLRTSISWRTAFPEKVRLILIKQNTGINALHA